MDARVVGRTEELARLDAAIADAAAGRPRVGLIVGDAGLGKTTLLELACERARAAGFTVMVGNSVDIGRGLPFAPLRAAFRALDPESHGDIVARTTARYPALSLLLPDGAPTTADPTLGEHGAALLFEGALQLVAAIAHDAPVLIGVEDLHWADRSTLELLTYLARNVGDDRVLAVATVRKQELDHDRNLRAFVGELQRLPLVDRVELNGLDRSELRELAGLHLQREPDDDELDALSARSEGNPFFALAVLDAASGQSLRHVELPATVRDALTASLDSLDDASARVARAAAAIGREVHADLLASVVADETGSFDDALRGAIRSGVLMAHTDDDLVEFRHALLQEAAYAQLVPAERRTLHGAIACHLRDHPGWSPRAGLHAVLAYHLDRAGESAAAFASSLAAADEALGAYGFDEAFTHLRRALDLRTELGDNVPADQPDEVDLRLAAADAALHAGRVTEAREVIELALPLVDAELDPPRWAKVAEAVCDLRWQDGDMAGSLALLDEALTVITEDHPLAWASVRRRWAWETFLARASTEGLPAAEQALEVARAHGDRVLEAYTLDTIGCLECALGRFARGIELLEAAFALGRELRHPTATARSGVNLLFALSIGVQFAEVERIATAGMAAAREMGLERSYTVDFVAAHARVLIHRGEWDRAEALLASTARPSWIRSATYVDLTRARLALGRGELEQAERLLTDAGRDPSGNIFHAMRWASSVAELRLLQGRADDAFQIAVDHLPIARLAPDSSFGILSALAADAVALGASRDRPTAVDSLVADAETWFEQERTKDTTPADAPGWVERLRARAAELAGHDSVAHWRTSADAFARCELAVESAWSRFGLARALLDSSQRDEAATHLNDIHEFAQKLGSEPLLARVTTLARRGRISLRSGSPTPREIDLTDRASGSDELGLSDREIEVLQLLADGRTNREIGEELFISTRTASVHVSNILRKLGVTNRGEAAAVAHRRGLATGSAP